MRPNYLLMVLVGFSILTAGCARKAALVPSSSIHVIEEESVRSLVTSNIYEKKGFRNSANLHAESLVKNQDHALMLAQIKDREQLHVHDEHDLIVHLQEGKGLLRTPDQKFSVQPGDWVTIARGVPHQFITTSEQPARSVVIRTPPKTDDRRLVDR